MTHFKRYFEISKVEENDDGTLTVAGIASTETEDVQGEVVTADAMKAALPEFFKYGSGNLREMHQPSAAGTVDKAHIENGTTFIECTVVDPVAVTKVKTGTYKGFSIGGKAISKTDGVISELRLSEISLVDRPANPDAVISMWKADVEAPEQTPEKAVEALAALLDKGEISPQRLIELAQAELAKSAPAAETTNPAPAADGDAAKADTEVQKGYFGEEVYDAQCAIEMLGRLMGLFYRESTEDEQMPEQIVALQTAMAALKTFIVSEIQEENSLKFDSQDDLAKAGKMISSKNMAKLQSLHDSLVSMGVACADMGKHEHGEDIAKVTTEKDEAIAKLATLEADITKLADDNKLLKAEVEKLKAMPAAGKALLKVMAISKSDDSPELLGEDTQKVAPVVDAKGQVNDAASLIKFIHSRGGAIVR